MRYADLTPRQVHYFWSKVDRTTTCWLWRARVDKDGYGTHSTRIGGRGGRAVVFRAHKLAYVLKVGPVPEGLVLDHICRVRSCVNPEHLRVVTHRKNVLAGIGITAINARKTHCPKGHQYSPKNTLKDSQGKRSCRTCRAAYLRRWRERRRASVGEAS